MTTAGSEQWIDEEDAECKLLIRGRGKIAAFLLDCPNIAGFVADVADQSAAIRLAISAHRSAKALLLLDRSEFVDEANADGVLLSSAASVGVSRAALGETRLIGAVCGASRHEAMVAGEAGADYVTFGSLDPAAPVPFEELAELADWWSDLAVIPAAIASPLGPSQVKVLAEAGAGFVLPTQATLTSNTVDRMEFETLVAALADTSVNQG